MADKLPEGIYLETKKSLIGTGSTAKTAEYRNFWVTLKVSDNKVEMILLDDAFGLTGIRETFTSEAVSGSNWLYVEQGEKKYQQLKPRLEAIINPPAKPQNLAASKKPAAGGDKKTGWWSK